MGVVKIPACVPIYEGYVCSAMAIFLRKNVTGAYLFFTALWKLDILAGYRLFAQDMKNPNSSHMCVHCN